MEQQIDLQTFLQNLQRQVNRLEAQMLQVKQAATAIQVDSMVRAKGVVPRMQIEFMAQSGEDMLAWGLFNGQTSGFFIEAGAFDGYHHAATYALEAVGWNGLLVEAIPERAKQCADRRPGSRTVNAALSPDGVTGETDFFVVDDPFGGMCSYRELTPKKVKDLADTPRHAVKVPRVSLNTLLADHQGPIDLVVSDLEGDEVEALKGFDLRRYRPRVMLIEDNTNGQDPALKNYMAPFEYRRVARLSANEVYIRLDEAEIFERLKWMMMPM